MTCALSAALFELSNNDFTLRRCFIAKCVRSTNALTKAQGIFRVVLSENAFSFPPIAALGKLLRLVHYLMNRVRYMRLYDPCYNSRELARW